MKSSGTIGESDAMLQLIRQRLEQLEVTPYHVSVATGHRRGWLGDILRRGGSPRLVTICQIADALGLDFGVLIAGAIPCAWPLAPAWLVAERAAEVGDESLPICGDCGRHRKIVARGMCAACYQRWRRART